MKRPIILATDRPVVKKTISENDIYLPNGYKIVVRKERISEVGRSIFRDFDEAQIVLEIVDCDNRKTCRLPIPSHFAENVAELIKL
ncbi:hypothetical protein C4A76_25390 [Brevibacillus laterosporus]|uniref:hypothetical protein n=1 Tax=Brevibacillus laterosporus TaxID=1465 RepID=UPI000CE2C4F9|nr:hypothetical protein [Brevibacillus laterosporus]PPA80778.1 hypothetical protein C4A76_25390 [Brevibacillus laterosporus]